MFLSSSAFSNKELRNSDSAVVTVTASDRPLPQPIQPEAEKLRRFASNDDKRQITGHKMTEITNLMGVSDHEGDVDE